MSPTGDSVTLRFVDAELRTVIQTIGRFLDRPVLIGTVPPVRVVLETPRPFARAELRALLEGLAQSHQLELTTEPTFYRIGQRPSAPPVAATPQGGPRQLFVHRLRHAKAGDVAAIVNQLFGGGGEFSSRSGQTLEGSLSAQLRQNVVPPVGAVQAPVRSVVAELSGAMTVVPDEATNSILVRGSASDNAVIGEAISQLDIRPLQVLIRVLIVEMRRDRTLSLGTDLHVPQRKVNDPKMIVSGTLTGGGQPGVLEIDIMKLGPLELDARIRAAQSRGDARIVSRPVILASNGQQARILVGSQRPFVQVSRSLPTDVPSRDQVIQYRNVGTELTVIPTINADGFVSMEILQEVSNATSETQFGAPIISTREAATRALVRDSQTVVIGGLRDQQNETNRGGIPILSRIPWIGALFGSEDRRATGTELYLFITPIVLRDDQAADRATAEALERSKEAVDKKLEKP